MSDANRQIVIEGLATHFFDRPDPYHAYPTVQVVKEDEPETYSGERLFCNLRAPQYSNALDGMHGRRLRITVEVLGE